MNEQEFRELYDNLMCEFGLHDIQKIEVVKERLVAALKFQNANKPKYIIKPLDNYSVQTIENHVNEYSEKYGKLITIYSNHDSLFGVFNND